MDVVIGLGGNALASGTAAVDPVSLGFAASVIADTAVGNRVVVTHGNGPQVGLLAIRDASNPGSVSGLDVLGAETEAMIGYLLSTALSQVDEDLDVVSVLTRVIVEATDPAFEHPTKPIGPWVDQRTATGQATQLGWSFIQDGTRFRRVVASPEPQAVVEARAIEVLMSSRFVVVCDGGGGIPVIKGDKGWIGVEAVIDKDLSSALLAASLGADALLLLTDVDGVYTGFGTPEQQLLRHGRPQDLREYSFEAGTMGPKVEAACRFVEAGGQFAAIGALTQASELLKGAVGTRVDCTVGSPAWW